MKNKTIRYANSTVVSKTVAMINAGAIWSEVEEAVHLSITSIRKILKEYYKTDGGYKRLCATQRENAKNRNAAKKIASAEGANEIAEEVIVMETGYIMDAGINGILNESLPIIIPAFCVRELEKLSNRYKTAADILSVIYSTNRIATIHIAKEDEILFTEAPADTKPRIRGIAALCCELFSQGLHVRLLTNSRPAAELAEAQGCGINVTHVPRRS